MVSQLSTWRAVTKSGKVELFSAYTYSDAYQQATSWAGSDLIDSLVEL